VNRLIDTEESIGQDIAPHAAGIAQAFEAKQVGWDSKKSNPKGGNVAPYTGTVQGSYVGDG